MKYPTGILQNSATGRYHPISFRQAPLPSEYSQLEPLTMCRHKSIGHHTEGFDTLAQAQEWVRTAGTDEQQLVDTGLIYNWDGVEMPAMVEWFAP